MLKLTVTLKNAQIEKKFEFNRQGREQAFNFLKQLIKMRQNIINYSMTKEA